MFAGRKKGTHRAAKSLQAFLRKVSLNGTRRAYYLKMDIGNFFMTIDRRILFEILCKRLFKSLTIFDLGFPKSLGFTISQLSQLAVKLYSNM